MGAFADARDEACPSPHVIEAGPGTFAITEMLWEWIGDMSAPETDKHAIALLAESYPRLDVELVYILTDWRSMARKCGKNDVCEGIAVSAFCLTIS